MAVSTKTVMPRPLKEAGLFDEIWTPIEALVPLLSWLPYRARLWDCAPGSGALIQLLQKSEQVTVDWSGDFLVDDPPDDWDMIVTNPPYSIKHKFLERASELGKPWALLLPVTTLGVRRCQRFLDDAEVVFLPKRIDFTNGGAPWFAVAWFTYGLNVGRQISFR